MTPEPDAPDATDSAASGEPSRAELSARLQRQYQAANENARRYKWQGPFFQVDPFDPVAHVIYVVLSPQDRSLSETLLPPAMAVLARRFVTLEARCRLLAELERHRDSELDIERRELLKFLAQIIERPEMPIALAHIVFEWLMKEVSDAIAKRAEIERAESEREHPLLQGLLEDMGHSESLEVESAAQRLAAFGEDGLPFLARALRATEEKYDTDVRSRMPAVIGALGRIPSLRSTDLLLMTLIADDEERMVPSLIAALQALGQEAAEALQDVLGLPVLNGQRRLRIYEALSGNPNTNLTPHLQSEFDESHWPEGEFTDDCFRRLVDLAVATEDRAFVPFLIRMLRRKALPVERRDFLRTRLQKSPWWEEVTVALRRLKEGKTVFVRADDEAPQAAPAKRSKRTSRKRGRQRQETMSVEEQRKLLMEAYHERLGWQRPVDLEKRRPGAMEKLNEIERRDYRTYCMAQGADPRQPDLLNPFEDFWLLTPHKELGDRAPWVVQIESIVETLPPYARKSFIEQQANALYQCACDVAEAGEKDRASQRLQCVLEVMPDHALAKRLLDRVEGREPERPAPRIIIPGR